MKKYLSEFIGTYILIFCGCGAVVIDSLFGGAVGHHGIALTFGLAVVAIVYALGTYSGAHINPAVTVGFALARSFPTKEIAPYILSQCLGATAAAGTLLLLFPETLTLGMTLPAGPVSQSFFLEIILTFFLMFIILRTTTGTKETGIMAGLAIGFVVWFEAMFAGPVSGASMNPARSLGPALMQGQLEHLWIYLTAPFLGSVLSVFVHRVLD